MTAYEDEYERWLANAHGAEREELERLSGDPAALQDAFFRSLAFGTAGMRGVMGVGSNRMNVRTVAKATQGLAAYLNAHYDSPAVAIARDSRNNGELFVRTCASVLAGNGIRSHVYPRIAPTPALSFAVRDLGCQAGINVTASHNPAEYNGYKVYGPDGCQITSEAARGIQEAIDSIDVFDDVKTADYEQAIKDGLVCEIADATLERFIEAVAAQSLEAPGACGDAALKVVYTPLNGTGLECVTRILGKVGIDDITLVDEQAEPDGDFPTCPYPNPEDRAALERGLALCEKVHPDILLATDPDADRVGVAVPHARHYELLSGNEIGVLLLEYICAMREMRGEDLSRKVAVTTVVSSAMPDAQALEHGFQLRRVLTGFKYIGSQIALLEDADEQDRFMFGFEESYGYMSGTHVRDKDAVNASMLICQMARWHKAAGRDLVDAIDALYERYGYYLNKTMSLSYPGASGAVRMDEIMARLREDAPGAIASRTVVSFVDYARSAAMPVVNPAGDESQVLPCADVVEFQLAGDCKLIFRPSGTEPKIKAYLFAKGATRKAAARTLEELEQAARELLA